MKKLRARGGRGALLVLALFLASSGALRIGAGIGEALANVHGSTPLAGDAPLQCPAPPLALAAALSARQTDIDLQAAALADRMAALALAEQAVALRLAELQAAEVALTDTMALADGAAEDDLARLTAVYEAMKPTDAAALFQTMASEFSAGFLSRMRPEAAAAILSGMTPESAYKISVMIAGRNAMVPRE